jgi:hypothetical protein
MREERRVHKVLVEKPEGKRPLGGPRHRWEDVIRMDLRETGWGGFSGFCIGTCGGCFEHVTNLWAPQIFGNRFAVNERITNSKM